MDEEEIRDWFSATHLHLLFHKGEFLKAEIRLEDPTEPEIKSHAKGIVQDAAPTSKILRDRLGNDLSVLDAWTHVLNQNPHMFAGIVPGANPVSRRLFVSFKESEDRYVIKTPAGNATVTGIVFEANLQVEVREIPMAEATRYSLVESGEALVESIRFNVEVPGQPVELGFHRMAQDGTTFISVRGSSKAAPSS